MASAPLPPNGSSASATVVRRPLVTLLDGRDCSVEMPVLKDVATVAFCDAQSSSEIHDKVLNEAYGALLWDCISLQREDLLKFKALKVIIKIGSGCDNIDVAAASELGIALSNIPHVGIEETADSTMAHVLALFRQNAFWANSLKEGKRIFGPEALREYGVNCHSLRGKTLGIVGLGRTGSAVALRAKVFGLHVIFFDPNLPDGIEISLGVEKVESLPELLHRSDCVTLHCSCNPNTRNLINEVTLKSMKQGAFLVNTASAHLIDEMALASMLREGRIAGAALDVHQHERTSLTDGPLADCPNLSVTPHCSWYSPTSDKRMREAAAQEMRRMIQFKSPTRLRYCVNADLLAFNARRQVLIGGGLPPGAVPVNGAAPPSVAFPMPMNNVAGQNNAAMPNMLPLAGHLQASTHNTLPHLDGGSTSTASATLRGLQQSHNTVAPGSSTALLLTSASNAPLIMSSTAQQAPNSSSLYSLMPNNVNMQSSLSESPSLNLHSSQLYHNVPLNSGGGSGGAQKPSTLSASRSSSAHDGSSSNLSRAPPGGTLEQQQLHGLAQTPIRSSGLTVKQQQQQQQQFASPHAPVSLSNTSSNSNGAPKRPHEQQPTWMAGTAITPPVSTADVGVAKKVRGGSNNRSGGMMPLMSTAKATVSEQGEV